jgi:hypothetical protein
MGEIAPFIIAFAGLMLAGYAIGSLAHVAWRWLIHG